MDISPELYLKFAKDIEPGIFENKTPKIHLDLIKFIDRPEQYKAAAVFRGAGKSTLLNKIYATARIYFKAEPFIMIASSNEEKAINFLEAAKNIIDKATAKGYGIRRGKTWNKDKIEVLVDTGQKDKNGKKIEKKCYVVSISAGQDPRGANINNIRPTLIIIDDLESKNGQYGITSKSNRQKLKSWFYADLLPALHPTKGKIVIIGTILHDDSILNNIINPKESDEEADKFKWTTIKIPILKNGVSSWPSRFPLEKIKQIKNLLAGKGMSNEFYQEYMCAAIDPQKAIFKREYFRYFKELNFDIDKPFVTVNVTDGVNNRELKTRKAKSITTADAEGISLSECRIFTTIDLASDKGKDQTAIVTSAIDKKNRIFIIDVSSGFWTPFEKSVKIIEIYLNFQPNRIGIEKAGMQNDFFYTIDVIQKLTGVRLPIDGLSHQGKAKNTRISNLEPYYRTGQIYHNASLNATNELEAQLLSFDPEVESKSDDLMDAEAYLLQYLLNRFFDERDYVDEEYDGWADESWV
ncbi:phage terminase large subunit family protein [Campylobacter sp. RM16192]|uniref:phage terminase large subunit family protein n=1 Tax=Campylobacter sp. RM16192 TaxID=1660080 RepID=UPI0014519036|nr:hypothetical protein [Campylobacter sp. RM16192]QCD52527.1 terminase domain protein [Campylobacter sp. RM16192]